MTYTVFKKNLNNTLSHKEHLNNIDELNEWLASAAGKGFNNIVIIRDQDGKTRSFYRSENNTWV